MQYKLNFELVPDGCWYSNLRTMLKPSVWDIIRHDAYRRANGRCMICNRSARRLEAHERWAYDEENQTQILTDVVALCHSCHAVIHIGRTQLMGKEEEAAAWFMKVNNCSYAEYRQALGQANQEHVRRNRISEWKVDISWINRYFKS